MSKYRELELLKEQEQTLKLLHMNFCDQLNRLKVEELALTNLLRLQKEREMQAQAGPSQQHTEIGPEEEAIEQEAMEVLNLLVSDNPQVKVEQQEEEEEEEEEEWDEMVEDEEREEEGQEEEADSSYNHQLTTYLEDLLYEQEQTQQLQLAMKTEAAAEEEEESDET